MSNKNNNNSDNNQCNNPGNNQTSVRYGSVPHVRSMILYLNNLGRCTQPTHLSGIRCTVSAAACTYPPYVTQARGGDKGRRCSLLQLIIITCSIELLLRRQTDLPWERTACCAAYRAHPYALPSQVCCMLSRCQFLKAHLLADGLRLARQVAVKACHSPLTAARASRHLSAQALVFDGRRQQLPLRSRGGPRPDGCRCKRSATRHVQ